jgi:subtilisin family serine protease
MKHNILGGTKSIVLMLSGLIITAGLCFAQAEESSPSVDPERELIVMFHSGAVEPPEGRTQGTLDEFQIRSDTLRQILKNAHVEAISRLIPNFQDEDRFIISRTGESVVLTDWTKVYLLRVPVAQTRDTLIAVLNNRPEVVYAEVNGRGEPDFVPNDEFFDRQWPLKNDGTAIQGNGTPGADIKATEAWDVTTGSSSIKIAIVDGGMQTDHPDFAGRVSGDGGDNDAHGTAVAGVAAAQGNNGIGIAGVAWNVGIINEDYGGGSDGDFVNAILSAINREAHVFNNSWKLNPVGRYSESVRNAFADAYKANLVAVASMGNQYGEVVQYPAAFGQGIITVGATTNTDVKANYSSTGNWMDVAAPGGGGFGAQNEDEDYIYSTVPGSGYSWFIWGQGIEGTSFSAPHVSGIAALLLSYNPDLYNDDIEQIIRLGVEDKGDPGFDNLYGTGRVDAPAALDSLQPPNYLIHWAASSGYQASVTDYYIQIFYGVPGLAAGPYYVKRYEVRNDVTFPRPFTSTPYAWGRGVATTGYSAANPNFGMGYCYFISLTSTGGTLRTWVYQVWTIGGDYVGWKPCSPGNVSFAYTSLGQPILVAPTLSVSLVQEDSNHCFHLTWNEDYVGHDKFEVQMESEFTYWATVAVVPGSCHSFDYTPAWGSVEYGFRARAIRIAGEDSIYSEWSNVEPILNVPNTPSRVGIAFHKICGWPTPLKVTPASDHDPCLLPDSLIIFPSLPENPSGPFHTPEPEPEPPCFPSNKVYVSWSSPGYQFEPIDYYKIRIQTLIGDSTAVFWFGPFYTLKDSLCLWPNWEYWISVVAYAGDLHSDEMANARQCSTGSQICEDYSHGGSPSGYGEPEIPVARTDLTSNQYPLAQNYPNPFNPETDISYDLPQGCHVKLSVFNIMGQKVRTLVDEYQTAGHKTVQWDGRDHIGEEVASGVYFYRLQTGEYSQVRKMLMLK